MTDPDERAALIAALIKRLRQMAMAQADTVAEMIEDNEDVGIIVEGRRDAQFFASCAAELARLSEEARALREALELAEIADWTHSACDDHDMDVAAEACGSCFGYADAARVARRNALQMRGGEWVIADGTPKDEIAAIIRAALARAKGEAE